MSGTLLVPEIDGECAWEIGVSFLNTTGVPVKSS